MTDFGQEELLPSLGQSSQQLNHSRSGSSLDNPMLFEFDKAVLDVLKCADNIMKIKPCNNITIMQLKNEGSKLNFKYFLKCLGGSKGN